MPVWVVVVIGVVVIIAVLLALAAWLLRGDSLGSVGVPDFAPELASFEATGSMRLSTKLECSVFRYHPRSFLYDGKEFPRTFEDGPWKWNEQQRYAPAYGVAGHFFALDAGGAMAEAQYYELDPHDRVMLEAEIALDDVLDLRWEPNVRAVVRANIREGPGALTWWLRALVHEERGGNELTDAIGVWAQGEGYKGILFFGARSISAYRKEFAGADKQLGLSVVGEIFENLRNDPLATNLVALGGVDLVRSIRRYRVVGEAWHPNEFYGVAEELVDAQLEHTSAERRESIADIIDVSGEQIFEMFWSGRVRSETDPST